MKLEFNLPPVQALGVALSTVFSDMEMGDCQNMAIDIIENLRSLGFDIVKRCEPHLLQSLNK